MRRNVSVVTVLAMAATVIGVIASSPATAATLAVTNCGDSGPGSLRTSVGGANSGDTIEFAMSPACSLITLASEILITTDDLTIQGPGADDLRISGNDATHVFNNPSATGVTISGLTIERGNAGLYGGGISNTGSMTVADVTLTDNTTGWGAALYNSGTMTVTGSTVSDNNALTTAGGGILNNGGGTMTVTGTVVSGNTAEEAGGISNGGTLIVTGSVLSGNAAAASGGGVQSSGPLTVTDSTVSANTALTGAGIRSTAALTITRTTVSANTTPDGGEGGGIHTAAATTITSSTISDNVATYGGGFFNRGALTIDASTVSGNQGRINGGGVQNYEGSLTVADSTFVGNTAGNGAATITATRTFRSP